MSVHDWEELKEEVITFLAMGHEEGEAELDTVTRLVLLERQKLDNLLFLLEAIDEIVTAALKSNAEQRGRNSNVLEWKKASISVERF
jgi:hypothetical protein